MLSTEEMNQITTEVTLGIKPERKDNAERAAFREEVKKAIAKMKKQGLQVRVPSDR